MSAHPPTQLSAHALTRPPIGGSRRRRWQRRRAMRRSKLCGTRLVRAARSRQSLSASMPNSSRFDDTRVRSSFDGPSRSKPSSRAAASQRHTAPRRELVGRLDSGSSDHRGHACRPGDMISRGAVERDATEARCVWGAHDAPNRHRQRRALCRAARLRSPLRDDVASTR